MNHLFWRFIDILTTILCHIPVIGEPLAEKMHDKLWDWQFAKTTDEQWEAMLEEVRKRRKESDGWIDISG